eukprot:jgi/Chlat1/3098/Chrsp21S03389
MAKRCCNSGVYAGFMLMSAAVLLALATAALGQSSPISACAAVLQQCHQYINNWIDPNVISSWQSCVKNFATGTTIRIVNGVNGDSVTLNILFSSSVSGATASLNGYSVTPTRAAVCTLFGPKVTATAKTSLVFPLAPSVAYNVYCVINATQLTRAIDVFVYTSPGGYCNAILYNAIPPTQIARLRAQIVNLQARVNSANQHIANCQALANSANKNVADLQSLVNSFYKNGEITVQSVNLFAYDNPGTIRYTISAFRSDDPKKCVLIIRDWLAQMRGEDVRIAYTTGVANLSTTEPVFLQIWLDAWKIASSTQQRLASIYDGTQLTALVIRSTSGQFFGSKGNNLVI